MNILGRSRSSMRIEIPGYKVLTLDYLVLDYNGTIATDGKIPEDVKEKIRCLAEFFKIYILTADTHGTASQMCEDIPVTIMTFPGDDAMKEKLRIVTELGAKHCIAIGNGRNDCQMCAFSGLSIAVTDREGMYGKLILEADICVTSILDALELFEYPKRLIATLRG